jgi:hypothetical protein
MFNLAIDSKFRGRDPVLLVDDVWVGDRVPEHATVTQKEKVLACRLHLSTRHYARIVYG